MLELALSFERGVETVEEVLAVERVSVTVDMRHARRALKF